MKYYDLKRVLPEDNLETVLLTFQQLRSHLDLQEFQTLFKQAHEHEKYQLFGFFDKQDCVAVIGLRPYCDFVRGQHLYIDDLVVHREYRKHGLGTQVLEWANEYAKNLGYKNIRLSTGIDNPQAQAFYERNFYKNKAIVYVKKTNS